MLDPLILLALAAVGMLAGFVDAIAGGGGMIALPALLSAGLPPVAALATNKLQSVFGTGMAALTYWRRGFVSLKALVPAIALTYAGALAGALVVKQIDIGLLDVAVPVALIGIALYFLFAPNLSDADKAARLPFGLFVPVMGMAIGFYDGIFGPGTGSFLTIGFVMLFGLGLTRASGNTKILNLVSNLAALTIFIPAGDVVWPAAIAMAGGQLVGGYVGARTGIRYGAAEFIDHMAWDGLTNPYDKQAMGVFGELCAEKFQFTREQQDAFAIESVKRSQAAQQSGAFKAEIVPVTVSGRKGDVVVDTDEQPGKSDLGKIPSLKAAFKKDGTITAASSSSISDGAAALVLLSADDAKARGLKPLARIVGHASHAHEPDWFTTAPVNAIDKLLKQVGWKVEDVDLFEVNEAFAVVAMAPIKELGIPHANLNVNGGACALGHPIGASGARLVVTLLHALQARGGKRGVASLCIGGGEATAIAVERL